MPRLGPDPTPNPPSPMISIDDMSAGASACLQNIGGERSFRRRLMELGLLPGTEVQLVRRADVGGVLELEVRGCRLSLRRSEARQIQVELRG